MFLATDTDAVAAENAPPSIHGDTAFSILRDQLAQTLKEENTLLGTMRETEKAASQSDAEYLLYQGSLRFAEQETRLAQLKTDTRQRLALLQEKTGRSTRLLHGSTGDPADRGYPPYSGAPLLSFHGATQFTPGTLPSSFFGILLSRLLSISALALTLFFPLMVIEKGTVHLRRKWRTGMTRRYIQIMKGLRGDPPGEIVRRSMGKGPHGATPKAV